MATKTELQAQIADYNKQINALKAKNEELLAKQHSYVYSADEVITSFNKDYNFGGRNDCWGADPLGGAMGYVNADQSVSDQYCSRGNGCGLEGCRSRIATINYYLNPARDIQRGINTNNTEINRLLGLISGLNAQVLALPESQAQIQSAVATAQGMADAEKKKWIFFGIIVIIIIGIAFFIFTRFGK